MKPSIQLDHEPVADGGWLVRALLRIEGEARGDDRRVPLNLSIVLDRSGSMAGEKIAAAKQAARSLVQRLSPSDTVSVVAFDTAVETIAEPDTGEAQQDLASRIEAIYAGATTNLSGGWLKGREHVAARRRDETVNRVLLMTDGLANVGVTDPLRLQDLCRSAADAGVTTTTIGFGDGFHEELLQAMADAGGGATYYIEEIDQAHGVFEEELEGLLSVCAQNLEVSLVPTAGNEFVQVWHDYPAKSVGDRLTVSIGDLYAREPRLMLAEFLLKPAEEGREAEEVEVATFTITADVFTPEGNLEKQTVTLPVMLSPIEGGYANPEVRKELLHQEAARTRREVREDWERGDFAAANMKMRMMSANILSAPYVDDELREVSRDLDIMAEQAERHGVSARERKYMRQREYDAMRSKKAASQRVSRARREED
ncbi:MAG: VWA domain-containing protein [marine benthic group bacterium]|nr:VWA domain-containing protein [Gemmatimonadota bacterium]